MAYDCTISISFPSDTKEELDEIVAQLTFLPEGALINVGISESESYQAPAGGGAPSAVE